MKLRDFLNVRVMLLLLGMIVGSTLLYHFLIRPFFEGSTPTIEAFAIAHFLGYLFFILSPVEAFFATLVNLGQNVWLLIAVALASAMLAQLIDYAIGYLVSDMALRKMIGSSKLKKYEDKIDKYGSWIIFIFNLFPLSSPIVMLVAGMLKFNKKHAFIYALSGLVIKYLVIAWIF